MNSSPLILGHRGASAVAPENTLAAFARAIRDGADGIEFDVRLARDNLPVVIHDGSLKRTGLIEGEVKNLTSVELGRIDVGSWFQKLRASESTQSHFAGERIPTLAQVFEQFDSLTGVLYVEMKCDPAEGPVLASEVVKLIREHKNSNRVVVESFDHSAIAAIKLIDPDIRIAALFEPKLSRPISTVRRIKMIDVTRQLGAEEIALHHTLASPRVVERSREEGLEVVVWTVDDAKWIEQARRLGIKALIANDPAPMVRHRNATKS